MVSGEISVPFCTWQQWVRGEKKEVDWLYSLRSSSKMGKKPLVALVAVMRKIVVIANAKIKDGMLAKEAHSDPTQKLIELSENHKDKASFLF